MTSMIAEARTQVMEGKQEARARDYTSRQIARGTAAPMWAGFRVLVIIVAVIMIFLYNSDLFRHSKRAFWGVALLLLIMLAYRAATIVQGSGANLVVGLL